MSKYFQLFKNESNETMVCEALCVLTGMWVVEIEKNEGKRGKHKNQEAKKMDEKQTKFV